MPVSISNLRATFANSASSYSALSVDVTNVASAPTSKILDLKVNGVTKFSVDLNGYPSANLSATDTVARSLATAAGTTASAGYNKANSANIIASNAYDKANAANIIAFSAFETVNLYSPVIVTASFTQANTALAAASAAFAKANAGYTLPSVQTNQFLIVNTDNSIWGTIDAYYSGGIGNTIEVYTQSNTRLKLSAFDETQIRLYPDDPGRGTYQGIIEIFNPGNPGYSVIDRDGNLGLGRYPGGTYALDVTGKVNASAIYVNDVLLTTSALDISAPYNKANAANILAFQVGGAVTTTNAAVVAAFAKANTANLLAYQANIIAVAAFAKANTGGGSNISLGSTGNTQVLYNDSGNISGSAAFVFYNANNTVVAQNWLVSGNAVVVNASSITVSNLNVTGAWIRSLQADSVTIGKTQINSSIVATSTTSNQTIDSFASSYIRSSEYTITITNSSNYHTTKISLLQDGTNVYTTQYASLFNSQALATFTATISSGTVRLNATPTFTATNFNVTRISTLL